MTAFSKPFHFSPRQENIQSNVNVNFDEIASYINARNDGTATWDAVSAAFVTLTTDPAGTPAASTLYMANVVKAWVMITYSGGTPAATVSFNVSSLTDNGLGDATVTFTRAFATANYAAVGTGLATLANDSGDVIVLSQLAASCRVGNRTSSATFAGEDKTMFWIFIGAQ